ncbi:uncharacterized protein AC631_00139 [Debaryomyces fabryi]|uniref:COMPASS component SDC1 n=1 Tax=Debaryomyces fabryi TaxID=58627 RepID=A0A0V1Q6J9_9ASCO|nr:uncharacterized protein AC631_00139 [Debaryomyces fabryi]KSA04060.1 hypothetical protein AC631_00139 [Debaryomyces fabryi]CUM50238.1 unnamed protein product [Debaryomyces fabryi]
MDASEETNKRELEKTDSSNASVENGGTSSQAKRPKTISEDKQDPNHGNELPVHEVVGGSSVRQYLNKHLTQHLLEALRDVSKNKPEDPLKYLGEFLIQRSNQIANGEATSRSIPPNSDGAPKSDTGDDTAVKSEQDN